MTDPMDMPDEIWAIKKRTPKRGLYILQQALQNSEYGSKKYHSDTRYQALKAENDELALLLEEATGWNWLDDDMPEEIAEKIAMVLEKRKKQEG